MGQCISFDSALLLADSPLAFGFWIEPIRRRYCASEGMYQIRRFRPGGVLSITGFCRKWTPLRCRESTCRIVSSGREPSQQASRNWMHLSNRWS